MGGGTPAQAQYKVHTGRNAPKGIKRIDEPRSSVKEAQWHAHDKYSGSGLNLDGSIHDKHRGNLKFGKDDLDFLFCHGWNVN